VAARSQLQEVLEQRIAEAEGTIATVVGTIAALDAERRALCAAAGLDPAASFDGALAEAERSCARHEAELAALRDRLREAQKVHEQLRRWREQLSIWSGLAEDLRPSRLLRHLLEEERRRLAAIAAERFENLSGGRYRFSPDGSFAVVDLANAEEVRRLDTLSGGETFLAALALALALAEIVAGSGGRLDAFFLDEGFGSLDQEHLRLALDGIERLVVDAPGRLVLLVSHVPEVQDRFDDVISLDREPLQGTSIIRSGASAS
jgi:exonuclease SbcC